MPKLEWDKTGEHFYETGIDQVVLFPMKSDGTYEKGVAWNGVTSVDENPSGGEANDQYADNILYLSMISAEKFGATLNAFQSPEEFDACDGTATLATGVTIGQQSRRAFGLAYRSKLGNDVSGDDYGYVIHLVYNSKCAPSQRTRSTINDSPEAGELSWEISSTPVSVNATDSDGKPYKPTSHLQISSVKADAAKLAALEKLLYGDTDADAKLPSPDEVYALFAEG